MHLRRETVPRKWPVSRKGTKYVIRPNSNLRKGIPILVFIRDMLKVAQNRKEVKKAIHTKDILINGKSARNEKDAVLLFDKVTLVPSKKNYKLNLAENGKYTAEEINDSEAKSKVSRVNDKKILRGKKTQLNLSDGRNYLTDLKCGVNDSVVIDFATRKISKCLPLKEKARVIVFAGKHTGKRGEIVKMMPERKMVSLIAGKDTINVLIKQIMVTEK